jgi:hypothetical protein
LSREPSRRSFRLLGGMKRSKFSPLLHRCSGSCNHITTVLRSTELLTSQIAIMASSAISSQVPAADRIPIKPWSRPQPTIEDLDWATLPKIDLSRFDEPGCKQELASQLYDAVSRVGFWMVINTGLDDERVLRQFSIGNAFFQQPLEEKRKVPCNFAQGEAHGYRENTRWIGDSGIKENIELVNTFSPNEFQVSWLNLMSSSTYQKQSQL